MKDCAVWSLYALLAELGGALHAGGEREGDYRGDGDEGDRDARRLGDYVGHGRVESHDRDRPKPSAPSLDPPRLVASVTAIAAEVIAKTPVA